MSAKIVNSHDPSRPVLATLLQYESEVNSADTRIRVGLAINGYYRTKRIQRHENRDYGQLWERLGEYGRAYDARRVESPTALA